MPYKRLCVPKLVVAGTFLVFLGQFSEGGECQALYTILPVCYSPYGNTLNNYFNMRSLVECVTMCSNNAICRSVVFDNQTGFCATNADALENPSYICPEKMLYAVVYTNSASCLHFGNDPSSTITAVSPDLASDFPTMTAEPNLNTPTAVAEPLTTFQEHLTTVPTTIAESLITLPTTTKEPPSMFPTAISEPLTSIPTSIAKPSISVPTTTPPPTTFPLTVTEPPIPSSNTMSPTTIPATLAVPSSFFPRTLTIHLTTTIIPPFTFSTTHYLTTFPQTVTNSASIIFSLCVYDIDCVEIADAECRHGKCQCTPGLSHDPSTNTCIPDCVAYGTTFQSDLGHYLDGFGDKLIENVFASTECKDLCVAESTFVCRTAEIYLVGGRCYLSVDTVATQPKAHMAHVDYNLYQRDCAP